MRMKMKMARDEALAAEARWRQLRADMRDGLYKTRLRKLVLRAIELVPKKPAKLDSAKYAHRWARYERLADKYDTL